MKSLLFFFLGIVLTSLSYAQFEVEKETDINRRGGSIALGTEVLNTGELLYFNALGEGRGNQLYAFDGDRHLRITSFSNTFLNGEVKEKKQSPFPIGAVTSHYYLFNNKTLFFAQGELTPRGLYAYEKGILKRLFECRSIGGKYTEYQGSLLFEVMLSPKQRIGSETAEDSVGRRVVMLQLDKNGKASLFARGKTQYEQCFGNQLLTFENEVFVCKSGVMYSTTGKKIYPDLRFSKYLDIQELFVFKEKLFFTANKGNGNGLFSFDKNGVIREHGTTTPNYHVLNSMPAFVTDSAVFFLNHSEKFGTELYHFDGVHEPKIASDMSAINKSSLVESMTYERGQLFFTAKRAGEQSFRLYQFNKDTLMEVELKGVYDIQNVEFFKGSLHFTADSKYDGREWYSFSPPIPPRVRDYYFTINDYSKSGYKIGTIEVLNEDQRGLRFEIASGDPNGIFRMSPSSGVLSIENPQFLDGSVLKQHQLKIRVSNREMSSYANVYISVRESEDFTFDGLTEKLLFFPDFSRKGVLTTNVLPDGSVVKVYTMKRMMVDQVVVKDGAITLGNYPAGLYILNVKGIENYFQRIEMQ
jgi:hypothetical protein